jgi:hypothetical protein
MPLPPTVAPSIGRRRELTSVAGCSVLKKVLALAAVLLLAAACADKKAPASPQPTVPETVQSLTADTSTEPTLESAADASTEPTFISTANTTSRPAPHATPTPTPTPIPTPHTAARTTQPPKPTSSTATAAPVRNCDPAYPDVCLHDGIGDYDCAGGSGNGPNYVPGPLRVLPPDPFGLDRDHDGTGCE